MPIYAYRCGTCGHAKEVLQKVSDPLLSTCPACGAETFVKQVTAAGFQLKGSGWYATDFRGGDSAKKKSEHSDAEPAAADKAEKADTSAAGDAKQKDSADKPAAPAADKPAPAAAPAAGPAASKSAAAPPPAKP